MDILVVDDDEASLESLCMVLQDLGHTPTPCGNGEEALKIAAKGRFPLLLSDIRLPGMSGLDLLQAVRGAEWGRYVDVILITGHGDMATAISALRAGAYDFLNKPVNASELAASVERSAEHQTLLRDNEELTTRFDTRVEETTILLKRDLEAAQHRLREQAGLGKVVAESQSFRTVLKECEVYHADPSVPVLIEGETGTGKEVVAQLIHHGATANDAPFVALNCAAIPAELFESELFGYQAGAFTGSRQEGAPGKLELAGEGTLFLDEIGEMPPALQPKLLRVLQERSYYRVGGSRRHDFQARVICATNQNLEEMIAGGSFRRDLYHRLTVGRIRIAPLRERPEDIEPLVRYAFENVLCRKKKRFQGISPETFALLKQQAWPGNIRELENVIERAVLLFDEEVLRPCHIQLEKTAEPDLPRVDVGEAFILPEERLDLDGWVRGIIQQALKKFGGNKTRTAEYLGMSRGALRNRLDQM